MKILVGIDGSQAALNALRYAITEVRSRHGPADLTLINVHSRPPSAFPFAGYSLDVQRYVDELAESELAEARQVLDDAGIPFREEKETGRIAETIARIAKEGAYQQIILGTKGRSNTLNILLGSVPQQVAALASCAVTLVPVQTE